MVWLPVAFACLTNGVCAFHHGRLSISIEQCQSQNKVAAAAMQRDADISAYQVECLLITHNQKDSV